MRSGAGRRSCTYVVAIDGDPGDDDLRSFARYLSTMGLAGCEVLILDDSSGERFEQRHRVLRWVGRHVAASPLDAIRGAVDLAGCEKVIVASTEARYGAAEVGAMCELLDRYEVVEPQEYVEPMPWWGGIDAGRLLLHRGVDQVPQGPATFAFRRSAFRPLRAFVEDSRRLLLQAAPVHEAQVFVRREPPRLSKWMTTRSREASSVLFLGFVPLLFALAIAGGLQVAGGYAGVMAFASVVLAVRGRVGAGKFFPLRACLYAPLWIVERSISVYLALFARLRAKPDASQIPNPESRIPNPATRQSR